MFKAIMTAVLASAAMALSAPAAAHPEDEFDSYNRGPTTSELAQAAVGKLVSQKKLPTSWNNAVITKFDVKTIAGADRYVVTFENPAVKQVNRRKLYVIMSTGGDFISASFKPV
jgi:hypothetical protein